MSKKASLILLRHGKSTWNERNLFTGWVDIPLCKSGIEEAALVGKKLRDRPIDIIFVSALMRSHMSAVLVMLEHTSGKTPVLVHPYEGQREDWGKIYSEETKENTIPMVAAWELNERMYGKLQGLNKQDTVEKFGAEQVKLWRRSYDVAPPAGESLKDTAERSIPFFQEVVVPHLRKGKNVFICAHGNSLRSIVMHIEQLSEKEVLEFELATGEIRLYHFQDDHFTLESSS